MLRGFYTAASGMLAQQRRQEALANNVANAQTPGFKQDQGTLRAFPELLIERMEASPLPGRQGGNVPVYSRVGALNTGVYLQETIPDFSQGTLRETGITTDMALVNGRMPDPAGNVLFTVQNEAGERRYTRNGNFTVDGAGYLVTNQGHYVLDEEGERIFTDGLEFQVSDGGIIRAGDAVIPLGIAYTADARQLVKEGQSLFRLDPAAPEPAGAREQPGLTFSVRQRHLEGSNVDAARAMTDMMQAYRLFETNQQVLKAYDQSMGKAVSEIARLR